MTAASDTFASSDRRFRFRFHGSRRVIGLKCVVRGFWFGRPGQRSSSQAGVALSATKQKWVDLAGFR